MHIRKKSESIHTLFYIADVMFYSWCLKPSEILQIFERAILVEIKWNRIVLSTNLFKIRKHTHVYSTCDFLVGNALMREHWSWPSNVQKIYTELKIILYFGIYFFIYITLEIMFLLISGTKEISVLFLIFYAMLYIFIFFFHVYQNWKIFQSF